MPPSPHVTATGDLDSSLSHEPVTSAINKGVESNQGKIDACFIGFLKAFDSFWQAGLTLNCRVMEPGGGNLLATSTPRTDPSRAG